MERIKLNYFRLPAFFIVLFLALELFLFTVFHISNIFLYAISALLFIFTFLLMRIAGRTNSVGKEIYLSVSAGLLLFYAAFAIPIFTGAITLNQGAFLFLIMFVLFVVAEKGNFRNILLNITISVMLLFEMIFYGSHGNLYFTVVLIFSVLVCILLGWMFVNEKPSKFESRAILQVFFSFSAVTALWSVFSLLK